MTEILSHPMGGHEVDKPREACGVVGVMTLDPNVPVGNILYRGLMALQHRGEDAAGIVLDNTNGEVGDFVRERGFGTVDRAIEADGTSLDIRSPNATCGVGHTRWSTMELGGDDPHAAVQPMIRGQQGRQIAVGHNGHIENASEVAAHYDISIEDCPTDTAIVTKMLSYLQDLFGGDLNLAMGELFPRLNGAYSMVIAEQRRLHAVRDPWGIRPLVLGYTPDGSTVIASEPAGLFAMGAAPERDIAPGEIYSVTQQSVATQRIVRERTSAGGEVRPQPRPCALEYVYLAREDDTNIYRAREEMGRRLADLYPIDADVVIGVPSSGLLSAQGFAEQSNIPLRIGFRRSPYISRTFIQGDQKLREAMVRLKLAPIAAAMKGKCIVVVDDSVIRGTTMRATIALAKGNPKYGGGGAAEVHLRIPSAKNKWPCYYGTDTGNPDDLLARKFKTNQDMADYLGADSLEFLPPNEVESAIGREVGSLCMACMDGNYPTDQPERVRKILLGLPGVSIPQDSLVGPLST